MKRNESKSEWIRDEEGRRKDCLGAIDGIWKGEERERANEACM
jgi:hypothetical protein